MANRLKITARSPSRTAASASSGRSLMVTTTTGTHFLMSCSTASALRSIWRSSRSTSQGVERSIWGRSSGRATSPTTFMS